MHKPVTVRWRESSSVFFFPLCHWRRLLEMASFMNEYIRNMVEKLALEVKVDVALPALP